jgi:hypothetical protein
MGFVKGDEAYVKDEASSQESGPLVIEISELS